VRASQAPDSSHAAQLLGDRADPRIVLAAEDVTVVHHGRRTGFFKPGPQVRALDGVSVHVCAGEVIGLVGESGSGKTTLGFAAAGFLRPTSGTITLNGHDLASLRGSRLRAVRSHCQMIFQDPYGSLDPRQRIGSALREVRGLHPHHTDWIGDAELLESVGLRAAVLNRYAHELSGGQAQRVAIARAILVRPSMIIADEATSALDVSVQAQIINLLLTLRDRSGVAILLISHDLAVVRQTSDRVYVLYRGKLVEEGNSEQVLENPADAYTQRLVAAVLSKGAGMSRKFAPDRTESL
jgi:peptide/nickel transport system ATP-binding protein